MGLMLCMTILMAVTQPDTSSAPPLPRIAEIESFILEVQKEQGIPGVSMSIVTNNQIAWSKAFGLADVENKVAASRESVFPIPGISRTITATAVLQLVQSGKVSLDTSIREFVPEYPDKGIKIAVRHVLANTSGVKNFTNDDELYNRKNYATMVDALNSFKDDRLMFKPGETFLMSAPAYNMLGLLIERISMKSLDDALRDSVFAPAGMTQSYVDRGKNIVPHRVRGYGMDKSRNLLNAPPFDPSDRLASDGLLATADDVARFVIALNTNKLLQPELVKVMVTPNKTNSGKELKYGLGCFVREVGGHRITGHMGRTPQASSFLLMFPETGTAVIVLTNLDRADVQWIALGIARLVVENFDPEKKVDVSNNE